MMSDPQNIHLVHADHQSDSVGLVPQPSNDLTDPLNWSKSWKTIIMVNQGIFVLISNITGLSVAPLTPIYMAEWNQSLSSVAFLTGALVITLGYANFVLIPCANLFGRRPVLLSCSIIVLTADVWQATAKSYHSFLAARIFSGIGIAANESIMSIVVADIFFLHQRGRFMGLYFLCYFISLMLGPIIAGNMAEYISWRWFFWVCTIVQSLSVVGTLLLFPETRRSHWSPSHTTPVITTNSEAQQMEGIDSIKPGLEPNQVKEHLVDPSLGRGRPAKKQFHIIQPIDKACFATIWHHILGPFQLFTFPIIFWVAMAMGAAANALLCVNLLQSQALTAPPYNFSPANVGFTNFALAVGAVIGLVSAGPFSDWVAARATKSNNGIREAEMRLPSLIPFILITIIGMAVLGVGWDRQWPWEVIIIIGFTSVGIVTVAIPTITITYAVDCYKPAAGQIMVVATVAKNTFGFGMSYYINDWAASSGFIQPVMLLMAMTAGFSTIGLIVSMLWGKKMRGWTKNSKVHHF